MKIVFMGTSDFALPSLKVLVESDMDVVGVYTQPPRRGGRGKRMQMSPIGRFATEQKLKLFYPENFSKASEISLMEKLEPDLVLVAAYGLILPKELLSVAKKGFFNIHASILPRWRGAAPIQRAILADDKITGVSIIKLEPTLDTGPIVLENHLQIEYLDNAGSLQSKLSLIGAKLAYELCINIGKLNYRSQAKKGITYAKKIDKIETQIDWSSDAKEVHCQIRAFSPIPGAWFHCFGERIKILKSAELKSKADPGLILDADFQIACGNGSILPLVLQRAGKSPLSAKEFLRGYSVPVGKILKKVNF